MGAAYARLPRVAPVSDTERPLTRAIGGAFAYDWVLRAGFAILVLLSVYTVLGDDLAQILGVSSSPNTSSSAATNPTSQQRRPEALPQAMPEALPQALPEALPVVPQPK